MRLDSLKYLKSVCPHNYIDQVLQALDAGKHVVIEFGSQSNMLSYMLATNMITRRIHANYVKKAEYFLQTKNPVDRPQQLVITIEEAHRFLRFCCGTSNYLWNYRQRRCENTLLLS
jgi:DNA helicase HerA-like ATPase